MWIFKAFLKLFERKPHVHTPGEAEIRKACDETETQVQEDKKMLFRCLGS